MEAHKIRLPDIICMFSELHISQTEGFVTSIKFYMMQNGRYCYKAGALFRDFRTIFTLDNTKDHHSMANSIETLARTDTSPGMIGVEYSLLAIMTRIS